MQATGGACNPHADEYYIALGDVGGARELARRV